MGCVMHLNVKNEQEMRKKRMRKGQRERVRGKERKREAESETKVIKKSEKRKYNHMRLHQYIKLPRRMFISITHTNLINSHFDVLINEMNKKNRLDANSPEYDVSIRCKTNWKKLPAINYQDGLKLEYIDNWPNTGNIHIGVVFICFDCKADLKQNEKQREKR